MVRSDKKMPQAGSEVHEHFFARELAGETPLTRGTAEKLLHLAAEFQRREPWELLADRELILVTTPDAQEICYCSVMGALGEVYSLQVYLGLDGYRLFKRLDLGEAISSGEFLTLLRGVSVEYVPGGELTPADRAMLHALDYPFKRGSKYPIFRATRPGYHPWFVTEDEGRILALCLESAAVLTDHMLSDDEADFWEEEDYYPLVIQTPGKGDKPEYQVSQVEAKFPSAVAPDMPELDERRIASIRDKHHPVRGIWEVGHFYSLSMIGERYERKACLHAALAIDISADFLLPPLVSEPSGTTGDLMVGTVLGAIEAGRVIPLELRVSDPEVVVLLGPLAGKLDITIRVADVLPGFEFVKQQFLQFT